jgi:hypothetical protein
VNSASFTRWQNSHNAWCNTPQQKHAPKRARSAAPGRGDRIVPHPAHQQHASSCSCRIHRSGRRKHSLLNLRPPEPPSIKRQRSPARRFVLVSLGSQAFAAPHFHLPLRRDDRSLPCSWTALAASDGLVRCRDSLGTQHSLNRLLERRHSVPRELETPRHSEKVLVSVATRMRPKE